MCVCIHKLRHRCSNIGATDMATRLTIERPSQEEYEEPLQRLVSLHTSKVDGRKTMQLKQAITNTPATTWRVEGSVWKSPWEDATHFPRAWRPQGEYRISRASSNWQNKWNIRQQDKRR